MSYVGGPGYELYVPIETARHVWLALHAASEGLGIDGSGLVDAGYWTLDALRIEAGRRAWGAELGPDDTPFEAGTMFAVKLDKRDRFIGRDALRRLAGTTAGKSLVTIAVDDADAYIWGGETIFVDGEPVGEVSSAGWSDACGRCLALGYVRGVAPSTLAGRALAIDVWGQRVPATAHDRWPPGSSSRASTA